MCEKGCGYEGDFEDDFCCEFGCGYKGDYNSYSVPLHESSCSRRAGHSVCQVPQLPLRDSEVLHRDSAGGSG